MLTVGWSCQRDGEREISIIGGGKEIVDLVGALGAIRSIVIHPQEIKGAAVVPSLVQGHVGAHHPGRIHAGHRGQGRPGVGGRAEAVIQTAVTRRLLTPGRFYV